MFSCHCVYTKTKIRDINGCNFRIEPSFYQYISPEHLLKNWNVLFNHFATIKIWLSPEIIMCTAYVVIHIAI